MTDEQIISALQECVSNDSWRKFQDMCAGALHIIERQESEIDYWKRSAFHAMYGKENYNDSRTEII